MTTNQWHRDLQSEAVFKYALWLSWVCAARITICITAIMAGRQDCARE